MIMQKNYNPLHALAAIPLFCSCCMHNAAADTTIPGDFFLFPNVHVAHLSGSEVTAADDTHEIEPAINVFYSYKKDNFLAVIEYFLNNHENEFERLTIGAQINNETLVWFGRFHTPLGIWNTTYHHGVYLQTSIKRPSIVEYEDDGGILPLHTTGFLINLDKVTDSGQYVLDLALGSSPSFETGEMVPMDIFSPGGERYHENAMIRFSYIPSPENSTMLALFAGHTRMEADAVNANEITQTQAGLSVIYQIAQVMLTSSIFYIDNELLLPSSITNANSLTSYYLQTEFDLENDMLLYARFENTNKDNSDPYLALFPHFVHKTSLAGLRYDFLPQHAVTLEFSNGTTDTGEINAISVQWSALLP